ncbi:MAG TPA: Pls/PosA family non-ribosomal peptide synthetase [Roseiarcus sp.]|nr:Pls/PosA family non-ribosomal peptide synthetase [Roseiarcus sp.]
MLWRYGERLEDVIEDACRRFGDRVAVDVDGAGVSFRELDARANQMARFFLATGVKPGERVAVLLDRGPEAYAALFALMKARATFVPLDANHPPERIRYVLRDASVSLIVTNLRMADRFVDSAIPRVTLDKARREITETNDAPLSDPERAPTAAALCYVLYTSGTTGHPKGVAVAHPSICNFVRVAGERYGFGPGDRVYQGMSIAFDFSVEELWVPLVAGATIVPNARATTLFDGELAEFLEQRQVTCLCCVPTLLASLERDLPKLHILLIGGEACPPGLVKRWSRPGRVLLNSYGPTETTVTATLGRLSPEKPVTIGRPLPTYSIAILDPDRDEALALGETGEIAIGGIGVAEGYLNRHELTEARFIPDFLRLPNNLSSRIYRTGDLGRINQDGEIEYLGRLDTQIKLRGHRIELTEIESVLLGIPEIGQAAAAIFEPSPGAPELVAYYSVKHGASEPEPASMVALMQALLPIYMIPAFLERLPFLPVLASNKTDREKLPPPKSPRVRLIETHASPTTPTERLLARALEDTLRLAEVSVDGDFVNEYGAHSLLMARFCARVRQLSPETRVAMRDVYANPSVRRLARAIDSAKPVAAPPPEAEPEHRPSLAAYYLCGAAQTGVYLCAGALGVFLAQAGLEWTYEAVHSPPALYGRALAFVSAWFFGHTAFAIAAKWLLLGRARPGAVPLWSLPYFRFWLARFIVRSAPVNAFAGTPLFNVFLRSLGARIGRNAVVGTALLPVAADLFSIGDDAVLARTVVANGSSAFRNRLRFDDIRIGKNAYVGEAAMLDIGATIGDFGQLGHASALLAGQRVPEGKSYHGSPAEETTTDFRLLDDIPAKPLRRTVFSFAQLLGSIAVAAALTDALVLGAMAFAEERASANVPTPLVAMVGLLPISLSTSLALSSAALVASLAMVYAIPRIARRFLEAGRIYPLYGFHDAMRRIVDAVANSPFLNLLFGDSVFIDQYLRFVGWRLAAGEPTGSNFGCSQRQDNPFLCTVSAGTVASDGLFLGNVVMSSRAFKLGECRLGGHSFLGTDVYVPPGARIGENCLLATKVMAPIDGPLRENVGLLGSPAFEIPRAASRDLKLLGRMGPAERRLRLKLKTRRNLATMAWLLASRWFLAFLSIYFFAFASERFGATSFVAMALATLAVGVGAISVFILLERASIGFGRLKPDLATVYDPAFWRVERYWKLSDSPLSALFPGTPMRNLVSRLLGVRIGRMVFDDGCIVTERTLVEIGDEANLNEASIIQAHSLEEGVYKSDIVRIGPGCAIGTGAFVHYGVTMHEKTILDADSFLMKGEITPPRSRWRGNPAKLIDVSTSSPA